MIPLGIIIQQILGTTTNNGLLVGLESYWKLDEASGDRVDSHGSVDLTYFFSQSTATGILGSAIRGPQGTGNYYYAISDDTTLDFNDSDFTISIWYYPEYMYSEFRDIIYHGSNSTAAGNNWKLSYNTSGNPQFSISDDVTSFYTVVDTSTTMVQDNWYNIVVTYNSSTQDLTIRTNDGEVFTRASTPAPPGNTGKINMLRNAVGRMDETGCWSRVLSNDEIVLLYNSGACTGYDDFGENTFAGITSSMASWWSLEESSGERYDSHGGNNLIEAGTPSSVSGKVSNAVDLDGLDQSLHKASPEGLNTGDNSWSVACWVRLDQLTADVMDAICSLTDTSVTSNTGDGFHLAYRSGAEDRFDLTVRSGSTRTNVNASTFGLPSVDTWYFLYAYFDADADEIGISVNDGTIDTASMTHVPNNKTESFNIGRWGASGSFPYWLNGKVDELGFWNRTLTPSEVTALYNEGNGISYSSLGIPYINGWAYSDAGDDSIASSFTPTNPSTLENGDIILVICTIDMTSGSEPFQTTSTPDWEKIGEAGDAARGVQIGAFWKEATGTNDSITIDIPASRRMYAFSVAIKNCDTAFPVHASGFHHEAINSTATINGIDVTIDKALVIGALGVDGGPTFSFDSYGWSTIGSDDSTSIQLGTAFGKKVQLYAGNTRDCDVSLSGSEPASMFQLALKPAPVINDPSDIDGCICMLDATVATSLYSDDGKTTNTTQDGEVAVWEDLSGNGNDWVQTTSANRPQYDLADSSVYFVGLAGSTTEDYLEGPDISSWTEGSFFGRFQVEDGYENGCIWGTTSVNSSSTANHWNFSNTHYMCFGTDGRGSESWSTLTPAYTDLMNYGNMVASDGTTKTYMNNIEENSTDNGAVSFRSTPVLGSGIRNGAVQYSIRGNMYKFCAFNRVLSYTERLAVDAWLSS